MKSLFPKRKDAATEKAKQQHKVLMLDIDYELTNLHDAMKKGDENAKHKAKERLKELHQELTWRNFYEK